MACMTRAEMNISLYIVSSAKEEEERKSTRGYNAMLWGPLRPLPFLLLSLASRLPPANPLDHANDFFLGILRVRF